MPEETCESLEAELTDTQNPPTPARAAAIRARMQELGCPNEGGNSGGGPNVHP